VNVIKILRYLKKIINIIVLKIGNNIDKRVYFNADLGGNIETKRSTIGFVSFMGTVPVICIQNYYNIV